MPTDYEEYNRETKKIRSANKKLLVEFESWLKDSGLSSKTIKSHCSNIDFYINEYLLYTDAIPPEEGMDGGYVSMFLGYWFIRKALWASSTSLKANAASLKKFGRFLFEQNKITKEELDSITSTIREEMPEWQATLKRYDDPSITDSEEIWGF
jgi:hypothetical protein